MSAASDAVQPNVPDARRIKAVIRQGLAEDATPAEIKSELVAQFGPGVLSIPPYKKRRILIVGLLLVGAAGLLIWLRKRRRRVVAAARDEERRNEELPSASHPEPPEHSSENLPRPLPSST